LPPAVTFPNVHTLAHALTDVIPDLGAPTNIALRPYNRYSTAFTTWWLVPSRTDWPAYHLSKLCMAPLVESLEPSFELLVGIEFEKGLAPSLAGLPEVDSSHIIKASWRWNSLSSPSFRDKLSACTQSALQASEEHLLVKVDAYAFNRVPDSEKPAVVPDDTGLWFIENSALALIPESPPTSELAFLTPSRDLFSLVDSLLNHRPLDFFWIELRLGHRILLSPEGLSQQKWSARDLWLVTMKPWLPILG
jgi:hypothetical protein